MNQSQSGFTLPELVMVLVLTGIVGAVAIPRFFNLDVYQQRFIYDQVLSAARYGHHAAVSSGCATQLAVTSSGFQLLRNDNCLSGGAPSFSSNPVVHPSDDTSAFDVSSLPSGVTLSAATVTFYADGTANADAQINVSSRTITITAATGYVR